MDFESVDTDIENAVWKETDGTAETNYFKMMMEDNQTGKVRENDNMDDSVIGGATLASVMNGSNNTNNNDKRNCDSDTIDSYSVSKNAGTLPNETMSIVGVEDDVSTIANDTVNETTKTFFSNGGRVDSKPRIRLFGEYKTPEKKQKSRSRNKSEGVPRGNSNNDDGVYDDDDDDTVPETPPGMIRVPGKSSSSSCRKEGKVKSNSVKEGSSTIRSKRVYIIAGVLAFVLFASIIALSVALSDMRDDHDSSTLSINSSIESGNDEKDNNSNNGNTILDIWPDLDATTYLDDSLPSDESRNEVGDDDSVDINNSPLTTSPIENLIDDAPSSSPTENWSVAVEIVFSELSYLLISRGAGTNIKEIKNNPNSSQYRATVWLARDPAYYDYSDDRIIQRWALAVFAFSWDSSSSQLALPQQRQRRVEDLPQGWLTYTDECTWFTSSPIDPCDESGMYRRIDIQDLMLGGFLPSELSLLSNSLKHVVLDGNILEGNIPTELSNLSNLESLRLRRNNLSGPILDFGLIFNLEILELGMNKLTGSIPNDLLGLGSLTELHLDYNYLTSSVPWDIGNLDSLVKLALSDNELSGYVPNSLVDLKNLEVLTLGNNNLIGTLPKEVCRFKGMEVLSVDCDAQGCECCTECATTYPPTKFPSPAPTEWPSSAPTQTPTKIATISPSATPSKSLLRFTSPPNAILLAMPSSASPGTSAPTDCSSAISVFDECYAPLVDIEISLKNCDPDSDDWVGLYRVDQNFNSQSLLNPNIWSWACGTRNCREEVTENFIPISSIHAGNGEWPLEPGIYVAVLARNSAQPYTAFAVSDTFIVEQTCPTF